MKNSAIAVALCLLISSSVFSQDYSLDNKVYQTISWTEFFNRLEKNPHLVYFDIRRPGERFDTSQYASSNQGRIKGALQADYYDFAAFYPAFLKHKEDTIYLYCSHSMRSRRLAQQLKDSSFKHLISINGGMSYLNLYGDKKFPLRKKYYQTDLKYKLITPFELGAKLKDHQAQVIDVRPDSIYNETGGDEQDRSYGKINGVRHIAEASLADSMHSLNKNKEIVLVDNYGDISPLVANQLIEKGFKNVSVLVFGFEELRSIVPSVQRTYFKFRYPAITNDELLELKRKGAVSILDIRTATEFSSTDTTAWKNVGRLKDAVNVPLDKLSKASLAPYKDKHVVIYDNMMMPPEIYKSAEALEKFGITNYSILAGGIYQLNWEIANTDKKGLKQLVE